MLCFGVKAEILLDESRIKAVEPGRYRRVGGEGIARARGGQCDIESLSGFFHETSGAFQYGKSRVAFVQMAHFRPQAKRSEQSPTGNPAQQLLFQALFRSTAVDLAGNAAMRVESGCTVAAHQL